MREISFDLENCYGIKELKQTVSFGEKKTVLVYAPNGTMKSSLAKTFSDISEKKVPCDRIHKNRITKCKIKIDGNDISPTSIFVADANESLNSEDKVSTFLASSKLKKEYDLIHQTLEKNKEIFINRLREISNYKECEKELINVFGNKYNNDFFSVFVHVCSKVNSKSQYFNINYSAFFDKNGKVKGFITEYASLLKEYFRIYGKLVKKSIIFNRSINQKEFGTYQLELLLKALDDDAFFEANHSIVLSNGKEIKKSEDLKKIANEEYEIIIANPELQKIFEKIDNAISRNSELRAFKIEIEKNPTYLARLIKYEEFRKAVWYGYFAQLTKEYKDLLSLYLEKSERLIQIIDNSKQENQTWKRIISIYKNRFYVPFSVSIKNQSDIVLKESAAHLLFSFNDGTDKDDFDNKDSFFPSLSRGEKRAFYIMQLLFELEARKKSNKENLIIFDDIADSFDYKNKYAIIEYISELINDPGNSFYQIILTHNFDFYRTVFSRLGLSRSSVYMAQEKDNGVIRLNQGEYKKDVFLNALAPNVNNPKCFIALIPFVRNIIEYTKGNDSLEYKTLTCCLHNKKRSGKIHTYNIFNIYKKNISSCKNMTCTLDRNQIIPFIINEAKKIVSETNIDEVKIENKIVLAIGCRLLAEKYLIKILKPDTEVITSNQTTELIKQYKHYPNRKEQNLLLLDKVNLMTPENIHVNAFMYEPLIDMSVYHLRDLFFDCLSLSRKRK